jgi:hypothetical protein
MEKLNAFEDAVCDKWSDEDVDCVVNMLEYNGNGNPDGADEKQRLQRLLV